MTRQRDTSLGMNRPITRRDLRDGTRMFHDAFGTFCVLAPPLIGFNKPWSLFFAACISSKRFYPT